MRLEASGNSKLDVSVVSFGKTAARIFLFLSVLTFQMGYGGLVLCTGTDHVTVETATNHHASTTLASLAQADPSAVVLTQSQDCADTPLIQAVRQTSDRAIASNDTAPSVMLVAFAPPIGPPPAVRRIPAVSQAQDLHPTIKHRRTVLLLI